MSVSEIISLVAVILSFIGVASSFLFSYRKIDKERDQERELNIKNITTIKDNIGNINNNLVEVKNKVEKIDDTVWNLNNKLTEHDQKIKHLEKEVYKK
jgi:peptidoglycan hydrolase CwlO-like protein